MVEPVGLVVRLAVVVAVEVVLITNLMMAEMGAWGVVEKSESLVGR